MTKEQEALLMAIGEAVFQLTLKASEDSIAHDKQFRDAKMALIIALDYFVQKEVKHAE